MDPKIMWAKPFNIQVLTLSGRFAGVNSLHRVWDNDCRHQPIWQFSNIWNYNHSDTRFTWVSVVFWSNIFILAYSSWKTVSTCLPVVITNLTSSQLGRAKPVQWRDSGLLCRVSHHWRDIWHWACRGATTWTRSSFTLGRKLDRKHGV